MKHVFEYDDNYGLMHEWYQLETIGRKLGVCVQCRKQALILWERKALIAWQQLCGACLLEFVIKQ